jgi:hypothetical protein
VILLPRGHVLDRMVVLSPAPVDNNVGVSVQAPFCPLIGANPRQSLSTSVDTGVQSGRRVHSHVDTEWIRMWTAEGPSMTRCPHCQALRNPTWATCPVCGQRLRAVAATCAPEPLTQYYPCVVCSQTDRWDDHGIWRCRACWPPGSLQRKAAAPGPAEVSHA